MSSNRAKVSFFHVYLNSVILQQNLDSVKSKLLYMEMCCSPGSLVEILLCASG